MIWMLALVASTALLAQNTHVHPNTCLKVESGATIDIGSGNLVIESDEAGDASLIDFGDVTYSRGGEADVERYLTEGQWHLISTPIYNALSGMIMNATCSTTANKQIYFQTSKI